MYCIMKNSKLNFVNYGSYGISELVKNLYAKIEFSTTTFLHIQIKFLHTNLHTSQNSNRGREYYNIKI